MINPSAEPMSVYYKPCGGAADYYSVGAFANITVCVDNSVAIDPGSIDVNPCGTTCTTDEDCTPCLPDCDCYTFTNTAETNKFATIDDCNYGPILVEFGVAPFPEQIQKYCVTRGSTITVDPGIVYYLCSTDCYTSGLCSDCTTTSTTTTSP